ncbi:serine hydrolase domain-containing protein [Chengkuizengella axinellae]|uniref:Serine hydrolase domain-containing protein n=1 Tax=Chengkuizengella axinellae TaxID=3064388 RepID=A0ABT9IWE8_9BACL|nr:serine hydrolase domain-containing protein [Chengkuizengella sp. 2205SS18-9]MDP5273583.1 serine hydrolase domain-containing protein [Chengkuizengella sp. 2205SS18-9]
MKNKIENIFTEWNKSGDFSGVFSVSNNKREIIFEAACGYRNMSESLENNIETSFGVASGTKILTGIAVCKLIEDQNLNLDDRVIEILDFNFPYFSNGITVKHLLTHTSGVPDYFDEEITDDYESIWNDRPVYKITELEHFLPLFQNQKMKFEPGTRYAYSNGGYILLGLIIEKVSGQSFRGYVTEKILKPCGMNNSGFFRTNMLPANTALGHIYDRNLEGFRTNIFSIPIVGASDGGFYTNAKDMNILWDHLMNKDILIKDMKDQMLLPHVFAEQRGENINYGLGVYINQIEKEIMNYHIIGYDPGVVFFSVFYPKSGIIATALANTGQIDTYPLLVELNKIIYS